MQLTGKPEDPFRAIARSLTSISGWALAALCLRPLVRSRREARSGPDGFRRTRAAREAATVDGARVATGGGGHGGVRVHTCLRPVACMINYRLMHLFVQIVVSTLEGRCGECRHGELIDALLCIFVLCIGLRTEGRRYHRVWVLAAR